MQSLTEQTFTRHQFKPYFSSTVPAYTATARTFLTTLLSILLQAARIPRSLCKPGNRISAVHRCYKAGSGPISAAPGPHARHSLANCQEPARVGWEFAESILSPSFSLPIPPPDRHMNRTVDNECVAHQVPPLPHFPITAHQPLKCPFCMMLRAVSLDASSQDLIGLSTSIDHFPHPTFHNLVKNQFIHILLLFFD